MSKGVTVTIIGVAAVFLVLLIVAGKDSSPVSESRPYPALEVLAVETTDPFKGPRDAPVTIIIASSFTCEYCQQAAIVMDQIRALYPDDVKIVWKDLPGFSTDAYNAARAARCAQLQGKFWAYHDFLYTYERVFDATALKQYAVDLGLRPDEFNRCYDNRLTTELINTNVDSSIDAGVISVPYFQINQATTFEGLQSLGRFRQIIDSHLAS